MRPLVLCALLLAASAVRADQGDPAEQLDDGALGFVRFAPRVELRRVHGGKVFARGSLELGPDRDRLVTMLGNPSEGAVAACDVPRHVIEAHDGERELTIEICFECNHLDAHGVRVGPDVSGTAPRNSTGVDLIFAGHVQTTEPADAALAPLVTAAEVELRSVDPDAPDKVYARGLLDAPRRAALRLALDIGLRAAAPERCDVRKTYAVHADAHVILFDLGCGWLQIDGGPRRPFGGQAVGGLNHLFPRAPRPPVTGAPALGTIDIDDTHTLGIPDGMSYGSLVFHLRGLADWLEPDDFVLTTMAWSLESHLFVPAAAVTHHGDELLVRFPPMDPENQLLAFDDSEHDLIVLLDGMPIAHRSVVLKERKGSMFDLLREKPPSRAWILWPLLGLVVAAGIGAAVVMRRRKA